VSIDQPAIRELLDTGAAATDLARERFATAADLPAAISVIVPQGYRHEVVDVRGLLGHVFPTPERITGTVHVSDVPSWLAYWGKHANTSSEVYARRDMGQVVGVLNASGTAAPEWGDHRVVLSLERTPEWLQWRSNDGRLITQQQFAEFIEDHLAEIVEPDAATMLELAQSFEASIGGKFKSATRLASGERRLILEETIDARAGQTAELDIPSRLTLSVRPFKAGEPAEVTARFRYRIEGGSLKLGYVLDRPDDREDEAFLALTGSIAEEVAPVTVLQGTPA